MVSLTGVGSVARSRASMSPRSRQPWRTGVACFRVREWGYRYDDEGSEARSLGSVSVGPDAWWSATLSVPGAASALARDTVLLRVERHGEAAAAQHRDASVELTLPSLEIDAVVTLLVGVVAQARRDGVLPAASA